MNTSSAVGHCGCDDNVAATPLPVHPAAQQSTLAWRVGRHPNFLASMIAGLSAEQALARLTTRDSSDPALALLDSWAVVLDVLSFYQ